MLKSIGLTILAGLAVLGAATLVIGLLCVPSLIAAVAVYVVAHCLFGCTMGFLKTWLITWAVVVCLQFLRSIVAGK